MITLQNLPVDIKEIAEKFNTRNEKIDVLPSKFHYKEQFYYVFVYAPSKEMLFVREDGEVPGHEEMTRPMLIVTVYHTSWTSMLETVQRWAKSKTKQNYSSLVQNLKSVERKLGNKLSGSNLEDLQRFLTACEKIVEDQLLIEEYFRKAVDLVDHANETEYVSETEQKQLRQYVVETSRAAVRQNQEQLDCERSRKALISYLESQLLSSPSILIDYISIKKKEKNLLASDSPTGEDMAELREMVREDKPIDELDNASELIALIRNPKRGE
ncbi:hypothetical protein [Bacillus sp. FJAT-27245]|uniref:hypothetical protein n=1 Tax=Bacillus sp. FJAT-27245 TaxID=1684144 RepID=UPI0006A797E9|nr:hypothetical protein [Bacillus sp. FJAT-27245]